MTTLTATRALTSLHARELLRDHRYFWFALLFPYGMLGLFLLIGSLVPKGNGGPDFSQTVIPMALYLAVTSAALTVTAGPLAGMRSKGTLRLLGTTPIGRARLLYTHMSVRIVMILCQTVVLLAIASALGTVRLANLLPLFGITVLGMALFGSIGYLIGGRLSSPDAATNVGTLIQLAALFLGGLTLPLYLLPSAVGRALSYLPTSFYADLMQAQLPSGRPMHPAWLSVLVVVVTTLVVATLAVRTFKWDQDEPR
jgi:ABC-2 type transport system permease protein